MAPSDPEYLVVGGGLGGALMAIYLGRAGHSVEVCERRPDPRQGPAMGGRSINLAISTRGLHALERAGLREKILSIAIPMRGRMVHSPEGALAFQPYGTRADQTINSVSRSALNLALLEAAESLPNVKIHFDQRCVGVDLESPAARFEDLRTGETRTWTARSLVGADGAYSAVRREMQKREGFDYQQSYLEHGYKELYIPPAPGAGFRLEKNALHIWPRGGFMMIALPNYDGSFTGTCFWPMEGSNSFAVLETADDVLRFFRTHFADAVPNLPSLTEEYFQNPTGSLVTIRCRPWRLRDRVVLLGDAAHAVVPFYGQGANAAFEDCLVLDECLRAETDREGAFRRYEELRKRNTDALADLSVENFFEMRDKTASRAFRAGKHLEKALHRLFPAWFIPLYTMVTFTRTPYAEAVGRARRQWRVVRFAAAALVALVFLILFLWMPPWN